MPTLHARNPKIKSGQSTRPLRSHAAGVRFLHGGFARMPKRWLSLARPTSGTSKVSPHRSRPVFATPQGARPEFSFAQCRRHHRIHSDDFRCQETHHRDPLPPIARVGLFRRALARRPVLQDFAGCSYRRLNFHLNRLYVPQSVLSRLVLIAIRSHHLPNKISPAPATSK
jgi:hypothetical protein